MNTHARFTRTLALLALAGVCALCGTASALPPPLPSGPTPMAPTQAAAPVRGVIVFHASEVDLGDVLDTEKPVGEFRFKNTGPGDATLQNIKPDCGCTVATLLRVVPGADGAPETYEEIDPVRLPEGGTFKEGEEGILRATYDASKRVGAARRHIRITTDNRDNRVVTVDLAINVIPLVVTEPRILTFGNNIEKGETATRVIEVYGRTADFEATKGTMANLYLDEMIHVEVLGTEDAELFGEKLRKTTLRLTLDKELKPGTIGDKLYVRTNDPRRPVVEVQVIGRVMGDLQVDPSPLRLGNITLGQPVQSQLRVTSKSGYPFQILGVELPTPDLDVQATYKPVDPANPVEWIVDLTTTGTKPDLRVSSVLNIKTDVLREEAVEVRFYGVVRQ